MIHPSSSSSLHEHAPRRRERLAWRAAVIGVLLASALTVLCSVAMPRRTSEHPSAATIAIPSFVQLELSEGDPPQGTEHRESPAKKPRLKSLLVLTVPAVDPTAPLAFHLLAAAIVPTTRQEAPQIRSARGSRRDDPALRLHPSQAPPHVI